MNLIGHLLGLFNHTLAYHLYTIPWSMYMELRLQVSEKKPHFSTFIRPPEMEIKIQKHYWKSTRYTPSYPIESVVCYLKCRWSSSDKPYMTKRHCSTLILPQGTKYKFQILTVHLQDVPNHILEYQLFTPEDVDVV